MDTVWYDVVIYWNPPGTLNLETMVRDGYARAVAIWAGGQGPCVGVLRFGSEAGMRTDPRWVREFGTASLVNAGHKAIYVVVWFANGLSGLQTSQVFFDHREAIAFRDNLIALHTPCDDDAAVIEVGTYEYHRPHVQWFMQMTPLIGPCVCET